MVGTQMQSYFYVAIVTLVTALLCFGMAAQVARTRVKVGIWECQIFCVRGLCEG
jgi:hypothetical protein